MSARMKVFVLGLVLLASGCASAGPATYDFRGGPVAIEPDPEWRELVALAEQCAGQELQEEGLSWFHAERIRNPVSGREVRALYNHNLHAIVLTDLSPESVYHELLHAAGLMDDTPEFERCADRWTR